MDGLTWHITGLWYPGADSVDYYGRITDPAEGRVEIPLNDSRRASVVMSYTDEIWASLRRSTYQLCLKCYYRGNLVFWGPITLIEPDLTANSARINAVDPSIRLIHHFLRRGDLDSDTTAPLTAANGDRGWVTVDHIGLRLLRDAGLNTDDQTTRGVPDLGIIDGTNDFGTPSGLMGFSRSDQVWNAMQQLSQALGPDFELVPIEDTEGAYAQLNTYAKQGSDVSATAAFHYGTGLQNLDGLAFTEGSKFITHVHVLDRDNKYRFTEANTDSSADAGVYVEWDATDFDAQQVDPDDVETVLRAYGEDIIKAYGRPLLVTTITPPIETSTGLRYLDDYQVGDIIGAAGLKELVWFTDLSTYRIVAVRLTQADSANNVKPEIDIIPSLVDDFGDAISGSEE